LAPVIRFAVSSPLYLHMGIAWAKIDQGCFDSKLSSQNMSSRLRRHWSTLRVNNPTTPLKLLLRYDMDNFILEILSSSFCNEKS
jgi:ribosome-associated toxin RatA of RatAB toxin-antitoxin module